MKIDRLESELEQLHEKLANPNFYKTAGEQVAEVNLKLEQLEQQLAETYNRWEELDALTE